MGLFSEYSSVKKILSEKHRLVFFAESRYYYVYFERLIRDILQHTDADICYITADAADPLLKQTGPRLQVYHVKWMLGFLWARLRAEKMVMTMPDLGNFLFKKAAGVQEYIYLFHAAVSTHQQYRAGAFDHFDTIFCTGDYQVTEIKRREELESLPSKNLVQYGYPLFDTLQVEAATEPCILLAPSWYSGGIFDACLEPLLDELLKTGQPIVVRSHPEFEKRNPAAMRRIRKLVATNPRLVIDTEPNVLTRLQQVSTLVTDRSGIAFEFAFGCSRPVLFIDTPLKQTNPDWEKTGLEPIENSLRTQLGLSVHPQQLRSVVATLQQLDQLRAEFPSRAARIKSDFFYNSQESFDAGWKYFAR